MPTMSDGLSSAFSSLNPFRRASPDHDEAGEAIDNSTVAGGGHSTTTNTTSSAAPNNNNRTPLRVSHALQSFLVAQGELEPADVHADSDAHPSAALLGLAAKPHINVPAAVLDRSHPLPEYFVSSSHNTYLQAHQLFGSSSAAAYETTLRAGARCVEIDAWDDETNADEPKVTHGFTLVSHIPFRAVCETIRDMVDAEAAAAAAAAAAPASHRTGSTGWRSRHGTQPAPVLVSLENHCSAHGQARLVAIMKEVWGDRLLSAAVRAKGHHEQAGGEHVTLAELGAKIVLIVEYHLQGEADLRDSSASDESADEAAEGLDGNAVRAYNEKRKTTGAGAIIAALAELGVYAQSVKPIDNTWFEQGVVTIKNSSSSSGGGEHDVDEPAHLRHHLINVSESGLTALLPRFDAQIGIHNAHHLMRVYPKGTRIFSQNMRPVPFWGRGAQICALNWQTFGLSLQLNEALFAGTDGYVLKPASLRRGGNGLAVAPTGANKKQLRVHVAGATGVPLPHGRAADDIKPYVTTTLYHPSDTRQSDETVRKRRTKAYKHHTLGFLHHGENPPRTDPIWDETLQWEYDDSELVFLRMLIKSEDAFAVNPILALCVVRVLYVAPGWNFIRMLDLKGRETDCSLLVKFDVLDVDQ
ncbi:phosphoinositide-specific phospholipase C [Coniella lustricola]|uniref:Phosphoinositide phospholipase C n=1 Tax=Coniella lustricola TaxID=2025994 RepID=A0A2T2ZYD8_9PEZI|nr:phosphoinositide-specific phospholipase C [Coniella lustricola]